MLGDSLTAGYGVDPNQAYPAVLEQLVNAKGYPDVLFTVDGISGSTSQNGLDRLKADLAVPGPNGEAFKYDILVLELGGNDLLKGLDLAAAKVNLAAIIQEAQSRGLKVLLTGLRAPPLTEVDPEGRFRNMYPELAKEYKVTLIPYLLEGVADKPELNLDEVHPNAKGHEVVAETVLKYLEPLL